MSQTSLKRAGFILLMSIGLALAVAACGGGSSSSSSTTATEASSETGETGGSAAAEAAKVVAPYVGHPSPFPVTEPLTKVPKGAHMIYADAGTPINALQWELLQGAAKVMGVNVERITAGTSANTIGPAMDSVVAKDPEAVFVNAVPPQFFSKQLKELQSAGVTITGAGISNGPEYGIEPVQGEEPYGKLLASYVIAEMNPKANVALYTVPEIPVILAITEEFETEFKAMCPECGLHTVEIHASELGNTAPNTIVSDLQAHPETNVAVFGADEIESGLPAAREAAGIEVETLGFAPTPTNLQYLKEGKETAGLADDIAIAVWSELDQAARELTGQKLTGPEAKAADVLQFLTKEDITFDTSKGWSGYPEFAEMFAKLWGVG
jgi:ribose transport system substrate-binding protein